MTKIQWTDRTANPLKVKTGGNYCEMISPGCANCYASLLNSRGDRFGGNGLTYGGANSVAPEMTLNTKMLASWARMRKPKKHFVGSMTDLFGGWVKRADILRLIGAMSMAPKQTFQILTKRPMIAYDAIAEWCSIVTCDKLPNNIWLGISAEDERRFDERIFWLNRIKANVKFLSFEPLLEPIQLPFYFRDIHWIIIGGESGPNARPMDLTWVIDHLEQCRSANIPAFVKQLGSDWAKRTGANDSKGGDPNEWPAALQVRMFPGEGWK